jgi:hypothetical protein
VGIQVSEQLKREGSWGEQVIGACSKLYVTYHAIGVARHRVHGDEVAITGSDEVIECMQKGGAVVFLM